MSILRIQNPIDFPATLKGGVVAIGNFDGVHRGHQSVLSAAVDLAKSKGHLCNSFDFRTASKNVF